MKVCSAVVNLECCILDCTCVRECGKIQVTKLHIVDFCNSCISNQGRALVANHRFFRIQCVSYPSYPILLLLLTVYKPPTCCQIVIPPMPSIPSHLKSSRGIQPNCHSTLVFAFFAALTNSP